MIKLDFDKTLIDETRIKEVTRKNGEKAQFISLILKDCPTEFSDGFVVQSIPKEERMNGEKSVILGNWKDC